MKNLSSLSKVKLLCFAVLGFIAVGVVADLLDLPMWLMHALHGLSFVAMALGVLMVTKVARFVDKTSETLVRCSRGDMESRLVLMGERGDLNLLADRINRFIDISDAYIRESKASMFCASNDIFHRKFLLSGMGGSFHGAAEVVNRATDAMREKTESLLRAADTLEETVKGIANDVSLSARQTQDVCQNMTSMATNSVTLSEGILDSAKTAKDNVVSVAAATEELSSSISEISRQTSESTRVAQEAVSLAKNAALTVESLSKASDQIGSVAGFIKDIADQTNLLALNATIEAARAGEAGKGFAVVATEVKNLAGETTKATEDISNQIAAIQGASKQVESAIHEVEQIMARVESISSSIAAAVEEQGAATGEISRNMQEATDKTEHVLSEIGSITQSSQETQSASQRVYSDTGILSDKSQDLNVQLDSFLAGIRKQA